MMNVIDTQGLTKYYGANLGISDVGLSVREGEIFGLIGPNGAGKTTTIRLLLGLLRPTLGAIRLFEKDVRSGRKVLLREIGYLPGDFGLYGELSGAQYLEYLLWLRTGRPRAAQRDEMTRLMRVFDIDFEKKIAGYSKGMRQIIGIIQAFMHLPRLVLLDEPTSGLDPVMQEAFYQLVLDATDRGATIFFSSHILREVERVCSRVGMIKEGKLLNVEALNERKTHLGKRIVVILRRDPAETLGAVRTLGGVHSAAAHGNRLEFLFTGDMHDLIRFLAQFEVQDFTCEPPGIEEAFLCFYQENRRD